MNVAIYGAGVDGEKFYWRWKDKHNIKFVIDKNCNREFHDLKVYSLEEIKESNILNCVEKLIVTTKEEYYKEISEALIKTDLGSNISFCRAYEFIGREKNKKKAVIYGNCHLGVLSDYLRSNREFSSKYFVIYYFLGDRIIQDLLEKDLSECDLLITQDIRNENAVHAWGCEQIINKCNSKCKVIKVPNLYGMNIYFPQSYLKNEKSNQEIVEYFFAPRDKKLEQMIDDGMDVGEMIKFINNKKFWSCSELRNNFDETINKLKLREEKCDIKISDYIERNYKKKKLFYDPNHPNVDVIREKGRKILNLLNMKIEESGYAPSIYHDACELFIYGCVKEALSLEFQEDYIKVHSPEATMVNEPINLEEYVEGYKCCYKKYAKIL